MFYLTIFTTVLAALCTGLNLGAMAFDATNDAATGLAVTFVSLTLVALVGTFYAIKWIK